MPPTRPQPVELRDADMPGACPALDTNFDLSLALSKLRELSLADGDLGYEYWTKVATLLSAVPAMQQRILDLEHRSLAQPTAECDATKLADLSSHFDQRLALLNAPLAFHALNRFMDDPVALGGKLRAGAPD
jgi:hypothetical protein